jgi:hypothetical protein
LDEGGQGGEAADTVEEPKRLGPLLCSCSLSISRQGLTSSSVVVQQQKKLSSEK